MMYDFDAVLKVAGEPVPSPTDPAFDAKVLERVQVTGEELERVLDRLDRSGMRYVSDGISEIRNRGSATIRGRARKPAAPAVPVGF